MWTFGWLLQRPARPISGVPRLRGRHDALCTDALTGQVLSAPLADAPAYQRVSDADFERLSGLRIPRDWKESPASPAASGASSATRGQRGRTAGRSRACGTR